MKAHKITNNVIYSLIGSIGKHQDVILDIEYSVGADAKHLEFERVQVSEINNLSESDCNEIEDILENGFEEDLIDLLSSHYKTTNIKFTSEFQSW